jgi:hypothetical protein
MLLVLGQVPVLDMELLFLIVWLTSRKGKGLMQVDFQSSFHLTTTPCRHMNIDYCVCQALSFNTKGIPQSLVEYDVGCQWSINFETRHKESTTLEFPEGMSLISGVGKFHLGTHEQGCFAKFSLNFIHGAGQQDGEILETLWAPLNKIAGSIRAMSKAARQEMLDDHMRDSNWKKLTKIGDVNRQLIIPPLFTFV